MHEDDVVATIYTAAAGRVTFSSPDGDSLPFVALRQPADLLGAGRCPRECITIVLDIRDFLTRLATDHICDLRQTFHGGFHPLGMSRREMGFDRNRAIETSGFAGGGRHALISWLQVFWPQMADPAARAGAISLRRQAAATAGCRSAARDGGAAGEAYRDRLG